MVDEVSFVVDGVGVEGTHRVEECGGDYCEEGFEAFPALGVSGFLLESLLDLSEVLPGDECEGLGLSGEDKENIPIPHREGEDLKVGLLPQAPEREAHPDLEVVEENFLPEESVGFGCFFHWHQHSLSACLWGPKRSL